MTGRARRPPSPGSSPGFDATPAAATQPDSPPLAWHRVSALAGDDPSRAVSRLPLGACAGMPQWIRPQLTQLVDASPDGPEWLNEIKFDGYRIHARLHRGAARLLPRTGLDWTDKYPAISKKRMK